MSQVPNYTEAPSDAQTEKKIQILEKTKPELGKLARAIFGGGSAPNAQTLQGLDRANRIRLEGIFAQEIALAKSYAGTAGGGSTGGTGGGFAGSPFNPFGPTGGNRFQGSIDAVNRTLAKTSGQIVETFKPVSSVMGETLGNLTSLARDPLGTIALIPGSLMNVIQRNFPEFHTKLEATFQKYNMDAVLNAPRALLGSLSNLITAVDAILSIPLQIISDLYFGLIDLIQDLADAIDQIFASFIKYIFETFLDALLPGLFEFLQELSALAGDIAAISTIFLGANQIAGFALNIQNYANTLTSFISNPLNTLFAFAPPQVSQALYLLRNPQQLINNILPPELSQIFAKVSQITGFGFNGNMGYGFVSVLQGLQGGVISSILNNFAGQYPILTSLLGLINTTTPPQNASQPPTITPSPVAPNNNNIKTGKQGVPVVQREQENVIPDELVREDRALLNALQGGQNAIDYIRNVPTTTPASVAQTPAQQQIAAAQAAGLATSSVGNNPTGGPNRVDI
jgi:hypothetical protein